MAQHARCAAIAVLEVDKHVMCEARTAINAYEANQMMAAARTHPRPIAQIVPSPMPMRVDRTLQKLFTDFYLGAVFAVDVVAGGDFLDPD